MEEGWFRVRGRALLPTDALSEEILEGYGSGALLRCKITRPRSMPHHHFFFAYLKEAFENWPEGGAELGNGVRFHPENEEHLRAWAIIMAGVKFRIAVEVDDGDMPAGELGNVLAGVLRKLRRMRIYAWPKLINGRVRIVMPVSIAHDPMDEKDFSELSSAVFDMIEGLIGLSADECWERWHERADKDAVAA